MQGTGGLHAGRTRGQSGINPASASAGLRLTVSYGAASDSTAASSGHQPPLVLPPARWPAVWPVLRRVGTLPAAALPVVVKATTTTTAIATTAAAGCLRPLLRDQLLELTVLQHLPEGPQGKSQNCHGGAQIEGFLQGAG